MTQPLGQVVQYAYDSRDRVDFIVNARGNKIAFEYEAWGPLSAERHYPTTSAATASRTIEYGYDSEGNAASITDDGVQVLPAYGFTYDALNRVLDESIKYIPGGDRVLQHRYDRYGNLRELTMQDGSAVANTYVFNKLNQLATAELAGAALDLTYYGNDYRRTTELPNAVTESLAYHANGAVETIAATGPAGQITQFAYTCDDVLNVDTRTDQFGVHDFNYDGLDRLTQALRPVASGIPDENYSYDGAGNRESPGNAALYDYDNNNRVTASPGLTYTYDADGNLATRSDGASFTFNARSWLIGFTKSGTTASYGYDGRGRRIRKTVNGTTIWFLWDGARILAEYDDSGNRTKRFAYLGDDPVPVQVQDANGTYYVHTDRLQTPQVLTNAAAQVVWRARYDAFGNAIVDSDPDGNGVSVELLLRLPGQYADSESGLLYNLNRWYSPDLGRYISADPLGLVAGPNVYLYANVNPLKYIDPLGLECGPWVVTDRTTFNTLKQRVEYLGEVWLWDVSFRGDITFDNGAVPDSIRTGSPPMKPDSSVPIYWYYVKIQKWLVQDYMEYWDVVKRSRPCAETYEQCGEVKVRSWTEQDTQVVRT